MSSPGCADTAASPASVTRAPCYSDSRCVHSPASLPCAIAAASPSCLLKWNRPSERAGLE
jgi:hypothetical protein